MREVFQGFPMLKQDRFLLRTLQENQEAELKRFRRMINIPDPEQLKSLDSDGKYPLLIFNSAGSGVYHCRILKDPARFRVYGVPEI